MTTNPYDDFLKDTPEAAYWGLLQRLMPSLSRNQGRFLETQYAPSRDQYMGAIGGQALSGELPTQDYLDWVQKWLSPGGGAAQRWAGMSPVARGEGTARFAPPVRFLPFGRGGFGGF